MLGKLRYLAAVWLLAGCTAVSWEQMPVSENWQENGWDTSYYIKINNYEMFIFTGQLSSQPCLQLFGSSDPYRQSWDKIIIRYANGQISQFTFDAKVDRHWIMGYAEKEKSWQNADFNCLRDEKNLKDLPEGLKNKIQQALKFGDQKYFAPPRWRTYPAPTRLTKSG